ncbi:MAG: hypothetical protein JRF06_05815 [Deltaproteobacteria bacterium]|nr:hypothetical protein [Deltaproteobacteria bacterium]
MGDLIKDEIVDGHNYYSQIRSDYNESISNWLGSPSFVGVQRVKTVIDSVITRIKRNPDIVGKPKKLEIRKEQKTDLELRTIAERFHLVVRHIRDRHNTRGTLEINDEYDVQDLFHTLLTLHYNDIRKEEWIPSYAGSSSRTDFFLPEIETLVEIKKTRKGLGPRELGEQLIIDIAKYQRHSGCKKIFCFVYDPDGRIANPAGIETDLTRVEEDIRVEVLIVPKGY